MEGGTIENVIPDKALIKGTIRTFREENRAFIHQRLEEIANNTAATFRASCDVRIQHGCPSIQSDDIVIQNVKKALKKMLPEEQVKSMEHEFLGGKILFSEDFSYITKECPGAILLLSSGHKDKGYHYPLHHPKVRFDEEVLSIGAAVHAQTALDYLRADNIKENDQ